VLSVGLPGFDPAVFLTALDLEGIVVSSGSACSSGATTGSHVLEAMGIVPEGLYAVLRFSFGPATGAEDIAVAGDAVARIARRLTGAGA
jgi:cysteine desulfurase